MRLANISILLDNGNSDELKRALEDIRIVLPLVDAPAPKKATVTTVSGKGFTAVLTLAQENK